MTNVETFRLALVAAYTQLFAEDPAYAYSASTTTPDVLATKMTDAMFKGSANYTGAGFKRACKAVGIKPTRTAILDYLKATEHP